ncbi:MAG: glutathione S-transferase family protein [Alphaproteobacteria bacterium]|nr:glutathione S-transferase family protein [Alphaproteobacteria bacterium]
MRILYHLWLSPESRMVRLLLASKEVEFEMRIEKTWERRPEFLAMNPAGTVPVLVEADGTVVAGDSAVTEYVDEVYPDPPMIGAGPAARAEVRRLVDWFGRKFGSEVTANLVDEKIMKRFLGLGQPNSPAIRAGQTNIHHHLDYIGWLCERRKWLAGDAFSLADIAAAAHLSAVDYLGDVPWNSHEAARDWYARVKSRPAFRPLLTDAIPGCPPPRHYADLDF